MVSDTDESLDNTIKTVVRAHHWPPDVIDKLYNDGQDHHGIDFWYYDALECDKEINDKIKEK